MLQAPTHEKMTQMKFYGMLEALDQIGHQALEEKLAYSDYLSLLIEAEWLYRENKKLQTRLKKATLKQNVCLEDLDYLSKPELKKSFVLELATGHFIDQNTHILITGPTGSGKSFLASALAHAVCLKGYQVLYKRSTQLFDKLLASRADSSYLRTLQQFTAPDLLVIDDWGLKPLSAQDRIDLYEVLEERYQKGAMIITSQIPPKDWVDIIGDPVLAEAIVDRLLHNAYQITLHGQEGSYRKLLAEKKNKKGIHPTQNKN